MSSSEIRCNNICSITNTNKTWTNGIRLQMPKLQSYIFPSNAHLPQSQCVFNFGKVLDGMTYYQRDLGGLEARLWVMLQCSISNTCRVPQKYNPFVQMHIYKMYRFCMPKMLSGGLKNWGDIFIHPNFIMKLWVCLNCVLFYYST